MTRKRNIGNVAAIGGATAMVALLTGLSGARADELADLRANQQLLQQRIDQLAQAQAQYHPPPPLSGGAGGGQALTLGSQPAPTAPSLGGSFPRSFLIPGTDTSIRVGGFVDITALDFLQGANSGNPGTPSLQRRPKRQPGWDTGRRSLHPRRGQWRHRCAVGQPFARQRRVHVQPAAIAARRRDPHPDGLGRVADVFLLRLGRRQRFQRPERAAGRRRQPVAAPPLRLWHVGRVPRRPGPLELLRCRRRHRIDGVRRHDGLDRRQSHPAGALYPCRSVWQRLLGVGRTTGHRHHRAERHDIQ